MARKLSGFNKAKKGDGGYALPLVLVMLALLMATSTYLINRNIKELEANQKSHDYEICILAAKNGMQEIKARTSQEQSQIVGNKNDPNGGNYSYQLLKTDEIHYEGTLTSIYRQNEKQFLIKIELDPQKQMAIKNFFWEMK